MASKKHAPAKRLNKGTHNALCVKAVKKQQKTVVKTTLENPFALDWPVISEPLEKEISSQLESCCRDLKIPVCKPPKKEVHKLRGEERITYCQEYRKTFLEKLLKDPVAAREYESAKEARSHLIFGYNAVMRALEHNSLAGILVKKDVQPTFLVQTFLPGCINKRVPLIPIIGLDDILKSEETLGVQHSVMVLGLKPSVKESSCRFYPLYGKMMKLLEGLDKIHKASEMEHKTESCQVLVSSNKNEKREQNSGCPEMLVNINKGKSEEENTQSLVETEEKKKSEQNIVSSEILSNINRENSHRAEQEMNVAKYKLSQEQIQSYHLKRRNKCERVFIPRSKKAKTMPEETSSDGNVLYIEPITKDESLFKEKQTSNYKTFTFRKEEKASSIPEPKGFCLNFFIDTTGHEEKEVVDENAGHTEEEIRVEKEKQNLDDKDGKAKKKKKISEDMVKGGSEEKKKKKNRKLLGNGDYDKEKKNAKSMQKPYPYVSAKTKRIKNNPNRKSTIKK